MHDVIRKLLLPTLCSIILVFALKHAFELRTIGYDQVPESYVVMDERAYVWQGLSIRQSGIPAAWSILGAYNKEVIRGGVDRFNITYEGKRPEFWNFTAFPKPLTTIVPIHFDRDVTLNTPIVQPWLDQPPVGSLILSLMVSPEIKSFQDLIPGEFRRTSLWLAVVTGLLIYLLGWQIFKNPLIGLMAAVIYSSAPVFALMSRYALVDNVLTPLMLITMNVLMVANSLKMSLRKKYRNIINLLLLLAAFFAGLAALTKLTGWFVILLGLLLLWNWKFKFKSMVVFAIPSIALGLLYFIWGLYLSPEVFIDIFRYQSLERGFIGSVNFLVTFIRVGILNFPLDGWWIGGFITLALLSKEKSLLPLLLGAIVTLLTALFLGGANYPWYYLPLIPFMTLAIAAFIWEVAVRPSALFLLIFFLIFFSSSFYWGYGVYQADSGSQPFTLYRIILLLFIAAGILRYYLPPIRVLRFGWFLIIGVVFYQLIKWNDQSLIYMLMHWGDLPSLYTPGTFTMLP